MGTLIIKKVEMKLIALCLIALVAVSYGACPASDSSCNAAACGTHSKCSSCVADLHCGWCASEGKCMKGSVAGPGKANCTVWDYAFCSGEPCAAYSECDSCTADPLCGWCATTGVCTEGSKERPVFIQCLARDWRHGPGGCGKCPSDKKEEKCKAPNKASAAVTKNVDLNADNDEAVSSDVKQ